MIIQQHELIGISLVYTLLTNPRTNLSEKKVYVIWTSLQAFRSPKKKKIHVRAVDAWTLRKIGTFNLAHPAFTTLYRTNDVNVTYNLLISTFAGPSLFSHNTDTVNLVRDIGSHLYDVGGIKPERLTSDVTWPNEVTAVPPGIFPSAMVAIPDGFLVPFKTGGSIKLMDVAGSPTTGPFTITGTSGGDWFYHRVEWRDMDGDGDQDIVTCRAREPTIPIIFGREDEELLWLENPSGDFRSVWREHVLAHGPDTFFRLSQMNTTEGHVECIIASQFFTKSLTIYWSTQDSGLFTDASKIQKRVIADDLGNVFDVEHVDINNDGRQDLLVTTNGGNGTLLAFEVPDDFRTGSFIKHTLAVGFVPRTSGIGKGAPGSALTTYPDGDTSRKPVILVSGDDDGRAYKFEAISEDPTEWTYRRDPFCDAGKGTVGQVSCADVDGDGFTDVIVPSYSTNQVFVYTFGPQMDTPLIG